MILEKLQPSKNTEVFNNILDSLTFNLWLLLLAMLSGLVVYITVKVPKMQKLLKLMKTRQRLEGATRPTVRFKVLLRKFFELKWSFSYSLSALGIFLLFFDLHFFFIKLFFTNNIKTNKVVYDTSNIIKNAEDALSTSKVISFKRFATGSQAFRRI